MKQRIITASILVCVMVPLIFLTQTPVLPLFFALISVVSVYELLKCTGITSKLAVCIPAYLLAGLSPVCARFLGREAYLDYSPAIVSVYLLWLASACMFYASRLREEPEEGRELLSEICIAAFFSLYTSFGFSFLILLADEKETGLFLVLGVFIAAYVTDIAAYFSGYLFGKHKLIPQISPKKTVEGAVGGVVMCTLTMLGYGCLVPLWVPSVPVVNLWTMAAVGFLASVVSQIGDLLMSALKRSFGIKDFGWLFPGHGGVLDRFDSVLAVSILTFAFNCFIHIFGSR